MTQEEAERIAYDKYPEIWFDDSYPGEEPYYVDQNSIVREIFIKELLNTKQ